MNKTWKNYSHQIPELTSIVSFINNNIPQKIGEHAYLLTFSNIFQENDFKKEMNNICKYLQKELKNSSISFETKVVENTGKFKRKNPEEILKSLSEQNPALHTLKRNLNLELD